jgi:hypothetical protein
MTMAKRKQTRSAIPYLQRLIGDEQVQQQLRLAGTRLHEVYRRASKDRGKAAEDRKVYDKLREAVTSLRKVAGRIEEPPRRRRRAPRALLALGIAAAGAGIALTRSRAAASEALPPEANNGSTPPGAADPSAETIGAPSGA